MCSFPSGTLAGIPSMIGIRSWFQITASLIFVSFLFGIF
nr:MAG TPA: hypothetical protein [Caudoviricetes sp.]